MGRFLNLIQGNPVPQEPKALELPEIKESSPPPTHSNTSKKSRKRR